LVRLIVFDTSDFVSFPIGGQLTSVGNFLTFLCESLPEERTKDILLVGVTKDKDRVGEWGSVEKAGRKLAFLPVASVETDLAHTAHSLRAAYVKGLLHYGRKLHLQRIDCCYVQTPEAVMAIRVLCPPTKVVLFSHGSYANMARGFRFYKHNPLVKTGFVQYLKQVLRYADFIFVLDQKSFDDYLPYTDRLEKVTNSVVLPEGYDAWTPHAFAGRLLFAGRLSKDKGLAGIIRAMAKLSDCYLSIVGDGEERAAFEQMVQELHLSDRVEFTGAVTPQKVQEIMRQSDILVMNSDFEGVPMVILEALANGLPVISTPVGGIPETVAFGKDAEKSDGSAASIAAGVRMIQGSYETYAKAAHEHAASYSYRVVGAQIYDTLKRYWM
jgi:glycosyltransferase involved in cell wall biosynthesis